MNLRIDVLVQLDTDTEMNYFDLVDEIGMDSLNEELEKVVKDKINELHTEIVDD